MTMTRLIILVAIVFVVYPGEAQDGMVQYELLDLADSSLVSNLSEGGELVLLEFWASWCSPCMISIDKADSIAARYSGKLQLVLVNSFDKPEKINDVMKKKRVRVSSFMDVGGSLYAKLGSPLLPYAVLHSADGKILWAGNPYYLTDSSLQSFCTGDANGNKYLLQESYGYEINIKPARNREKSSMEILQSDGRFRYLVYNKSVSSIIGHLVSFVHKVTADSIEQINPPFGPFVDLSAISESREDRQKLMGVVLESMLRLYGASLRWVGPGKAARIEYD